MNSLLIFGIGILCGMVLYIMIILLLKILGGDK